ncbi:MAG: M48 family metallopeptidase [Archaeoglobaceae archaeon]|nr:M48 family metallopeptidase [Archaeoglobaceae archaeon]
MVKTIRINDKNIRYSVSRRKVKYPRLEFKTGNLILVLPEKMKDEKTVLEKHKAWIYRKSRQIERALREAHCKELNENMSMEKFKYFVRKKVAEFSKSIGVEVNNIMLRKMVSKWGSLSFRRNITINSYARYLPDRLIEYIIYHEIAHLLIKKHNNNFWKIIESKYANYKEYEKDLFKYWFLLQHKILPKD